MPYLSASEVVIHEEALYQVYIPLHLPLPFCDVCSFLHVMPLWHNVIFDMYRSSLCWHWNMLVPSFLTKSATITVCGGRRGR